ncbi:aromatic ring-hydroxylating dioxygenase subunit alpha [Lysinibacillus telephonicus]|uniref:Aromatic ring-hydroxylating dioxygenase subunit alpha n=1 Tax=Lysinibacillus telephonicus TaxID=1714840 RepID=A0A431UR92_9BACI|nr:aromatic ring-hydroxylating dioxygenase subunit alpha [Lysinibacillus telephonicus]RTQ92734.1 aromatic ring-hydroxylating dioxygenase subunit alpha [Lysinibacillus telephonicus]
MLIEDRILRNQWIVACREVDLGEEPIQVTILGERVVIFKNDEGTYAFKDLCIHRGAALSLGQVKDGCLVCPYHGWIYNSNGQCVKIPQLPEGAPITSKAKAIPYGCKVAYGFIWVNLNNNEPELFNYPEYIDLHHRNVIWGPQNVKANPPRIIENFLDVSHLAFVHEGFLGIQDKPLINDYKVHTVDNRIFTDEIIVYQPDSDGTGIAKDVLYTYEVLNPLTARFTKCDPITNNRFSMFMTVLPVGERDCIVFGVESFNYDIAQTDEEVIEFQNIIFAQDKPIVENQKPEELPLDLQVELSLKFDRLSIAYRKYLKQQGVKLGVE